MKHISKKYNSLENTVEFNNKLSQNSDCNNDVTKEIKKGAIYYRPLNSKTGHQSLSSYIYQDRYENEEQIGVESTSLLGFQIGEKKPDSNGISISYFELGAIVSGIEIPEPIICRYTFPKIGNPGVVNPEKSYEIRNFIRGAFDPIKKSVYDHIIKNNPNFFEDMFSNNFFLKPVSSKSLLDEVLLIPEIKIEPVISPIMNEKEVIISMSFGSSPSAALHDKTLFDLVFKFINEFVLAPHGIFANKSWDNFVIMHVTDIHISRRIEYAKDDLKKQPDFIIESNIRHFNNFNDNFRDFISYANSLHKNGSLDCILATGDLVDYIFDSSEKTAKTPADPSNVDRFKGNNFDFFKRLILGLEPGRDGTKNEELLVPVFTSLGNHDYREFPYCWIGKITLDVDTVVGGIPLGSITPNNSENTNLLPSEAIALERGKRPEFDDEIGKIMVHINRNLPQYENTINSSRSYMVKLGPHRIVMLDSGPDVGIIDSEWGAIFHKLGWDSDDSKRFGQSSPNTEGIKQEHLVLLNHAFLEAGTAGLVIVGIHAPLIDMSYYPHYLRETDWFAPDVNIMQRGFPYFAPFFSFKEDYNGTGKKNGWPMEGKPFKKGGVDFTLANGISKGEANERFLKMCAGVNSRKVD